MQTKNARIIDIGRGPQVEGIRITVLDVFYYLHRGYDFDIIHRVMPILTHEQFDAVIKYVNEHREELVQQDLRVEKKIQQEIAEQKANGLRREIDTSLPVEERAARLKQELRSKLAAEQSEKNGGHPSH